MSDATENEGHEEDVLGPGDARFEQLLDERAEALARVHDNVADHALAAGHLVFVAGSVKFAIASENVSRVLRDTIVTRMPGAPNALGYVVHASGRIVSVVDPMRFVDAHAAPTVRSSVVLLHHGGRRLGLFADSVLSLERIDEASLAHENTSEERSPFVLGTTSSIVVLLDAHALLDDPLRAAK